MSRDFVGGLVSPSDIAVLAEVTRAAVSNWRKRRDDFPAPVGGTTANPLFNRAAVEDWLNRNGHPVRQDKPDMAAWSLMNKYRGQLSSESMVVAVHALLCARKLFDDGPRWGELLRGAESGRLTEVLSRIASALIPDEGCLLESPRGLTADSALIESFGDELVNVIDRLDLSRLAEFSDQILRRACSSEGRTGSELGAVGDPISALLGRCAAAAGGTVYDPACGIGETLIAAYTSGESAAIALVGHESDPFARLVARQRCFLHGVPATIAEAQLLAADPDPSLLADAIVAHISPDLPAVREFSATDRRWAIAGVPSPKHPETAWIQHAINHLAPEGHGYLVAGPATTFATSIANWRRQLVHAGCVEAVIGLPAKMIPTSAAPAVVWVVCRPGATRTAGSILIVDASNLSPTQEFPITDWLADHTTLEATGASWTTVAVNDVLADLEVSLSPRGLTESIVDPKEIVDRYAKARTDMASASRSMSLAKALSEAPSVATSHVVTIRQLERQGSLDVFRTKGGKKGAVAEQQKSDPSEITISMVRNGLPGVSERTQASIQNGKSITEPGDVLVTTTRALHAVVDAIGGRSVGSGVTRLRVDKTQFDPRYVAACVTAGWNQHFEMGFYSPNANIRDLEIPMIPLEDQKRVVQSVDSARAVADAATLATSAASEIAAVLLESVRFNVDIGDSQAGSAD